MPRFVVERVTEALNRRSKSVRDSKIHLIGIAYKRGVRRVYWNPTKRVTVTTARSATYKVGVYGTRTKLKGGSTEP